MEEPIPRTLALAYEIVALVRKANVSGTEQSQALSTAGSILNCYSDRGLLPEEMEDADSYHRTRPAS